jgi:hypothetical protein
MRSLRSLAPVAALSLLLVAACSSSGALVADGGPPDPLACGAPPCGPVTLATNQGFAGPITVSNGAVYWIAASSGNNGTVRTVPTTGGTPRDLATLNGANPGQLSSIAADEHNVYWFVTPPGGSTEIDALAISDGGAISDGAVSRRFYAAPGIAGGIVAYGGFVYTSSSQGLVKIGPTGAVTVIAADLTCNQIAVDATYVYCAGLTLVAYPTAGGEPATLLGAAATPGGYGSIATDGIDVYIAEPSGEDANGYVTYSLLKLPISSAGAGSATVLAQGVDVGSGIVVGNGGIFWESDVPSSMSAPLTQLSKDGGTPVDLGVTALWLYSDGPGLYYATSDGVIAEQGF